jgi:hypothetical protein
MEVGLGYLYYVFKFAEIIVGAEEMCLNIIDFRVIEPNSKPSFNKEINDSKYNLQLIIIIIIISNLKSTMCNLRI